MPTLLESAMSETGMDAVRGLLIGRAPEALDVDSPHYEFIDDIVAGITTEVAAVVGVDPPVGLLRDLALRTIAIGVARDLEEAIFPEQQDDSEDSRARQLNIRFLALLNQLRELPLTGGDITTNPLSPVGAFPDPVEYPDAAYVRGLTYPARYGAVYFW